MVVKREGGGGGLSQQGTLATCVTKDTGLSRCCWFTDILLLYFFCLLRGSSLRRSISFLTKEIILTRATCCNFLKSVLCLHSDTWEKFRKYRSFLLCALCGGNPNVNEHGSELYKPEANYYCLLHYHLPYIFVFSFVYEFRFRLMMYKF